ncbi:MAG: helix-turn-helix domain-containing protein [Bdellovibrio sp.]|nr:helix-turn-helix domain-containing protein [Bdellovibrio sp.]
MLENQRIPLTQGLNNQNQWMGTMDTDKTIGILLREARENKGHSLKKISQHTKINLTLLEALEEDRLEKLPNKAYVVGFVKAYAQLVDLNPLDCIETLNRTYSRGSSQKPKRHRTNLLKSEGNQDNSPALAMGLALVVLVLIGLTVVFLNSNSEKIIQKPVVITQNLTETTPLKLEGTQGLTIATAKAPDETLLKNIIETTSIEMSIAPPEVVLQEQLMRVGSEEHKEMLSTQVATTPNEPVSPIANTIASAPITVTPAAVPTVAQTVMPTGSVAPVKFEAKTDGSKEINFRAITDTMYSYVEEGGGEALEKYVPKNIQAAIVKNKQNVYITAVDGDTWLTYKKDQEPVKRFTLTQNKSILLRANELRIFLGNANVARVFLNNKLLDISSKNGIKSLVIPKENASKYHFPLFIYENGQTFTSDEYIHKKNEGTTP